MRSMESQDGSHRDTIRHVLLAGTGRGDHQTDRRIEVPDVARRLTSGGIAQVDARWDVPSAATTLPPTMANCSISAVFCNGVVPLT